MRIQALSLLVSSLAALSVANLPSVAQAPPTVADAKAFVDRANAELLKVGVDASHAQWTAETNITEDTQMTSARMNEVATARALAFAEESHRFDRLDLPADLKRQIKLLQVAAPAAPKEPALLAEETQLAAQLTGMYGK